MSLNKIFGSFIEYMPQADTVGSIDFGILAASWSPDESLLALITGTLLISATDGDYDRGFRRQQADVDDIDVRCSL